jgi:hypothetical protein
MKFKPTPIIKLSGIQLTKFNNYKKQITKLNIQLNDKVELAANDIQDIQLF